MTESIFGAFKKKNLGKDKLREFKAGGWIRLIGKSRFFLYEST